MSSSASSTSLARPRAARASVGAGRLRVILRDGREISVPVSWFSWLANAGEEQQQDLRILEDGAGIWWEQLDEGVSVPGLFGLPEYP